MNLAGIQDILNGTATGPTFKTIPIMKPIKPRKPRSRTNPPRRHSLYWTYFAFITESDGKVNDENIVCKLCGQTYRFSGNTTNLKTHLARQHPAESAELEKKNVPDMHHVSITPSTIPRSATEIISGGGDATTSPGNMEVTTLYVVSHPDTVSNSILSWIYSDLMPVNAVMGDGFRRLMMACNPSMQIPALADIVQGVNKLCNQELAKITAEVKQVSAMSVSVELWNAREKNHYITVRGFWISDSWNLQAKVLNTRALVDSDDSVILATEITNCLSECQVDIGKVICIVAASNAELEKAVADHLGVQLIPCLAHNLNTTLKKAMETPNLFGSILQRIQSENGESLYDPEKCWSSTYDLLVKAIDQHPPMADFVIQSRDAIALLGSFKQASDGVCLEKYPPASMLLPVLYRLLSLNADTTNSMFQNLRQRVIASTSKYWENEGIVKILNAITFLDPRFKTMPHIPHLGGQSRRQVEQFIHSEVGAILELDGDQGILLELQRQQQQQQQQAQEKSANDSLMGSLLGSLFDNPGSFTNDSQSDRIQEEINRYSLEQRLNPNCSPLEWWRAHQANYPMLAKVARKYLCISCTSVPASWVLTEDGENIQYKRAGVEQEYREKLVFLHENAEPVQQ